MKIVRVEYEEDVYTGIFRDNLVFIPDTVSPDKVINVSDARLLPPAVPSKIICAGLNYRDHAVELGMEIPDEPVIFLKPATALIGHRDHIVIPGMSGRVDYEAELAVVIGARARNIGPDRILEHIMGYTCFNDVTARDIQKKDVQWTRAKSFDTFAPTGPWIETDLNTSDLGIRAYLNGGIAQESRTSELIFGIPSLVSFISSVMTLLPGDIIATGTPPGVGQIKPGDEVIIEIDGIGKLCNHVSKGHI